VIRRTACTLGAVALLTPAVIGLGAGTAFASGSFSSPTPDNGSTLSSASFQVRAATTAKGTSVSLTGPGGFSASKSSSTGLTASSNQTVTLDPVDASGYPNGTWTARVSSGETRAFYSNFAPAAPTGFAAESSQGDPHDVFLSWTKGSEPDLQSYTLYDGAGNALQSSISAASACSGSSCHYALYYDNATPGTYSYSYTLTASRSGGCGASSCPDVESAKSSESTASLTTPKPPPPSPTPRPTTAGGSTGGTTGGSGGGSSSSGGGAGGSTGGSSSAATGGITSAAPAALPTLDPGVQKRAFALGFSNFSSSLGIPKLPPLPSTTVTLPGEAPLPQGTYVPTLPYKSATETTHSRSIVANPIGSITSIDHAKLAKCLAFALLLILSAAHLRRWVGSHIED
jgi:hypothetical protein